MGAGAGASAEAKSREGAGREAKRDISGQHKSRYPRETAAASCRTSKDYSSPKTNNRVKNFSIFFYCSKVDYICSRKLANINT